MSKKIHEKLTELQNELKAPKGQYNNFGKYHYRSAEDIVEAVKPLLGKYGLSMIISDELQNIGNRYYINATVKLTDWETGETLESHGYAREEENKKGMDGAQITGASSSYARKYALNGMFAIDDTKDSDTNEYRNQAQNKAKTQTVTKANNYDIKKVRELYKPDEIKTMLTRLKLKDITDLSKDQAKKMIDARPNEVINIENI